MGLTKVMGKALASAEGVGTGEVRPCATGDDEAGAGSALLDAGWPPERTGDMGYIAESVLADGVGPPELYGVSRSRRLM